MKDIVTKLIGYILVILTFTYSLSSPLVYGQQNEPISSPANQNTNSTETQQLETNDFTGKLLRIESNILYIETSQGATQITVPQDIQITKDTMDSDLQSLQTNDRLTVTQTENGNILSISAISGDIIDWGQWLIPGIIILTILGIIIWLLSKKTNQAKVKT